MSGNRWTGDRPVRVLLDEDGPAFDQSAWEASLDEAYPGWRDRVELRSARSRMSRRALLPGAVVFVSSWVDEAVLARGEALRWVHLTMSGGDRPEALPSGVRLTSAAAVQARGLAEHALGLMIALDRRFDVALERQRRWAWSQDRILDRAQGLYGRTLGILGLGHGGGALARLARAAGMRVVGMSRRARPVEGVERVWGPEGLSDVFAASAFVAVCVPATEETRGLVGRRELETLGPDGYLVNVARGDVVDEAALADALRRGVIAGAATDVLTREPPPRRHPLRGCPNLIVTPHVAANVNVYAPAIRADFAARLRAAVASGSLGS